ncbi:precorrin-3B C(17)-methyltransferase [Wenxinia marina]|nr:precorrin-3B C(17)-methyltransferase [Wenxinia marina]
MTPVVIALTARGAKLGRRVADAAGGTLHGRAGRVRDADATFENAADHVRDLFAAGVPVIGVCASGILIRAVAPLVSDKRAEPALVAVAEDGSAVVPLLGGHGGANRLARRVAEALGIGAAVTTAGDLGLGVALDEPPAGWRLVDPAAAKGVAAGLLAGEAFVLAGRAEWLAPVAALPNVRVQGGAGAVTLTPMAGGEGLRWAQVTDVLGLGCARGAAPAEALRLIGETLEAEGVDPAALACVATLDLKADEPAVHAVAQAFGLPVRIFPAAELEAVAGRLANPSDVVFAEVGCHGVAEGAALAAAGPDAVLSVEKRKSAAVTCAVARAPEPVTAPAGRPRGRLSVVGIGPGQGAWRSPEASRLIAEADELVGYSLYLDLLGPLAVGKARADFPLGGEEARCRHALERAGEGANVALVCSGDAGIYAMGALVFELLDRAPEAGGVSDAARRAEVVCAPGISALQAAAARAGAPLGHDFCTISLSDLLTPREDILQRIRAAAEGDFVIAFYNPVSRTRRTLLAEARDILLRHRPAETPVLLASNLGRPEEALAYRRLDEVKVDEVDMLTVVLVGSSNTRLAKLGEGPRMYTPRGYARKIDGDLA